MICPDPKVHDPHPFQPGGDDIALVVTCEGRTAPAPPEPAPVVTRGKGLDAYSLQDQRRLPYPQGRRQYDNRTGMPKGQDGDRLYGRRASDPRP